MACRKSGDIMPRESSCNEAGADWKKGQGIRVGTGAVCASDRRRTKSMRARVCDSVRKSGLCVLKGDVGGTSGERVVLIVIARRT